MSSKSTYKCPSCTNTITVFVNLSEPPVCTNKHIKGGKVMKKVEEQNDNTVAD